MNKLIFRKQLASFFVIVLLCFSCLSEIPVQAASAEYAPFFSDTGYASAFQVLSLDISMPYNSAAKIGVVVPSPVGMSVTLFASDGMTMLYRDEVTSEDGWVYDNSVQGYPYVLELSAPTLDGYVLTLCFDDATAYAVLGVQEGSLVVPDVPSVTPSPAAPEASAKPITPVVPSVLNISQNNLTLTKGFSSKLSASGGSGKVRWSSSNPNIASVNSSGKVTAKGAGTTTISAVSADGAKATCKVKVKANCYSKKQLIANDIPYMRAILYAYKVSYNSKGDLVIKTHFLNNCGRTVTELRNIKITVKDGSGHLIGSCSKKKKAVSVFSPGGKRITFTIKKSKLKQKSVKDLRKAVVKTTGNYYYEFSRQ